MCLFFLPGIGDASETGHKSRLGPGLGVNLYALEPGRVVVLVSHKKTDGESISLL